MAPRSDQPWMVVAGTRLPSAWLIWRAIGRMPPKSPMMRRTPMYAFVRKIRTAVNGQWSMGNGQRAMFTGQRRGAAPAPEAEPCRSSVKPEPCRSIVPAPVTPAMTNPGAPVTPWYRRAAQLRLDPHNLETSNVRVGGRSINKNGYTPLNTECGLIVTNTRNFFETRVQN